MVVAKRLFHCCNVWKSPGHMHLNDFCQYLLKDFQVKQYSHANSNIQEEYLVNFGKKSFAATPRS